MLGSIPRLPENPRGYPSLASPSRLSGKIPCRGVRDPTSPPKLPALCRNLRFHRRTPFSAHSYSARIIIHYISENYKIFLKFACRIFSIIPTAFCALPTKQAVFGRKTGTVSKALARSACPKQEVLRFRHYPGSSAGAGHHNRKLSDHPASYPLSPNRLLQANTATDSAPISSSRPKNHSTSPTILLLYTSKNG